MELAEFKKIDIKRDPRFNEAWLQDQIAKSPSLLGLGELELKDRERKQSSGGRLDLLLETPDSERRYEVELQLGKTDESHIIRCIEYWDIERRKYPAYDHIAVLIAEDITSRFLNVISLFSGNIPLLVIQVNAIEVENKIVLNFLKVLDLTDLRSDDSEDIKQNSVDRSYWEEKRGKKALEICDQSLEIINAEVSNKRSLNYLKNYIGLADSSNTSGNFVSFRLWASYVNLVVQISNPDGYVERLQEAGFEARRGRKKDRLIITIRTKDELQKGMVKDVFKQSAQEYSEKWG